MMGWHGGGMSLLGWVAMGMFWVLMLGLVVWLIARLFPGGKKTHPAGDSPVEVLNRGRAGGEIDLAAWQAQRAPLMAPVAGSTDRSTDSS